MDVLGLLSGRSALDAPSTAPPPAPPSKVAVPAAGAPHGGKGKAPQGGRTPRGRAHTWASPFSRSSWRVPSVTSHGCGLSVRVNVYWYWEACGCRDPGACSVPAIPWRQGSARLSMTANPLQSLVSCDPVTPGACLSHCEGCLHRGLLHHSGLLHHVQVRG